MECSTLMYDKAIYFKKRGGVEGHYRLCKLLDRQKHRRTN